MRIISALLFIFPLTVLGHVHVNGVTIAVAAEGGYRRLFDPVDPNFCNAQAQQGPISCLKNDPQGTPYCSSFISIPTATVCTTATLPPVAGTATITTTVTAGAILPRYINTENTDSDVKKRATGSGTTALFDLGIQAPDTVLKRHVLLPRQLGGCFPPSESATYSSSICSCLGIPTPTITTTFYVTLAAAATQVVTVTTTPTASPTARSLSSITVTSGSVGYTSTVPTTINGIATQVVVVGVPAPSTVTVTSGSVGYTSTVPTTINGVATQVVVVGVPAPNTITVTSGSVGYTSTVPTTINGVATQVAVVGVPTPSCTATGLTYTAYTNPYTYSSGDSNTNPNYNGFNATYFNGLPASSVLFSGTTSNVSFNLPSTGGSLYGSPRTLSQTAIAYTGYFVPPVSGTYRLGISSADDIGYLWMGLPASSRTWGESNWNVRSTFALPSTATVSQSFIAGQLYPIVILYANGAGDGGLQFSIVTPTGSTVTDTTGYFLQPSCGTSGLTIATVQPSAGLGTPNSITVTSGSVGYTSTVPTTVNGVATQVAVVNVPAPSTVTVTSGSIGYTSTVPTTVNGVATQVAVVNVPTPSCTATGLIYNAYTNPFPYPVGAGAADPSYNGFNATYFNGLPTSSVLFSGTTNNINFYVPAAGGNLYGSPRTFTQTAITYTGYFVPPVSGTYRLGFSSADDVAYLWMGLPASARTWGESNWNVRSTYFAPSTATVSQSFIAGQLYPIQILIANGGGDGGMQFSIVTPTGSTVTDTTGYFLQPSCGTSGLTIATVQPSAGLGTPNRITVTSGSVGYTSTVPTTVNGIATQVAVVNVPAPSTVTVTSGGVGYTSTVPTTINGVATQVAVVVQPQTPFHVYVTDFGGNVYGYLDMNNNPVSASTYNATTTDFASSSLYYLDATTGQLAVSPASGGITQPLYSVQTAGSPSSPLLFSTNQPTTNVPILVGQWADGTLRLANTANQALAASLCSGTLFVQPAVTTGCTQVVLSPVYNAVNYTTVTITSGTSSATRTYGPAGTLVSSGGTVTNIVPAPTCTASGIAYAAFSNPYTVGGVATNPYYVNYNATFFNSATVGPVLYSGVTDNVNFNFAAGTGTLYGTPRILTQQSIVYSGYFRVPTSGTYSLTFPLSTVDDVAYVWMGQTVTANTWGESNWNLRGTYSVLRSATPAFSQVFVAGSLYPIRILYGNAPGGAVLQLNIVNPAGTTITDTTGYFVQPSCANSGSPLGSTTAIDVTTCSATGIEWSMHNNPALGGSTFLSPTYPTFDPGLYNGALSPVALAGGITGNIQLGIASPAIAATIYNQGPYDLTQKAFVYRGYFAANVTGSWTFTYSNPDDIAYMWFGGTAISTWTKANANLVGSLNGNVATYTVSLTAGTLYPIRMVLGNSAGAVSFTLQTLDPLGTTRTATTGFFRQIHCGNAFGWT